MNGWMAFVFCLCTRCDIYKYRNEMRIPTKIKWWQSYLYVFVYVDIWLLLYGISLGGLPLKSVQKSSNINKINVTKKNELCRVIFQQKRQPKKKRKQKIIHQNQPKYNNNSTETKHTKQKHHNKMEWNVMQNNKQPNNVNYYRIQQIRAHKQRIK